MTGSSSQGSSASTMSTWSALRQPLFRALWLASLTSNIGTWIQDVGTVWLMTSLAPSAIMVSLAQTAMNLPFFVLALPAGALADVMDRRRLLLLSQLWMFGAAMVLGVLTIEGVTTPWLLLALTFAIGMGAALNAPTYQAITPEVVPKAQLPAAVSLNSVGINLARAVGPALGGFIVAMAGSGVAFLMNAATFLVMIGVLYHWKRPQRQSVLPAERFVGAMHAGIRFIRHAAPLQAVLVRAGAFILFASAFWALLPLLVRFELQLGPAQYGTLLACFGVGAVAGTTWLPRLRTKVSNDTLVGGATLIFAALLLVLAFARNLVGIGLGLLIGGAAWLTVLATLNSSAQAAAPGWVRGRALAVYLLVFFGGMAGGSALWGTVATYTGVPNTFILAGASLGLALLTAIRYRLVVGERLDLTPSLHWPAPALIEEPGHDRGPVFVTVEYRIDPGRRSEFVQVMQEMRTIRLRDGAIKWELLNDNADPARFVETFVLESWVEHLRQHERVTIADREVEHRARAFHVGSASPSVSHFLSQSPLK